MEIMILASQRTVSMGVVPKKSDGYNTVMPEMTCELI
jgi:hypothetical protein